VQDLRSGLQGGRVFLPDNLGHSSRLRLYSLCEIQLTSSSAGFPNKA
jgi:hypothetical protein